MKAKMFENYALYVEAMHMVRNTYEITTLIRSIVKQVGLTQATGSMNQNVIAIFKSSEYFLCKRTIATKA